LRLQQASTPAVGYKQLAVNHAKAAIQAFGIGFKRKIGLTTWFLEVKTIFKRLFYKQNRKL